MTFADEELYPSIKGEESVFNFLSHEDFRSLSPFLQAKHIPAGETLWQEDDSFDYIAYIISGKVEVRKEAEFGDMNVVMGVHGKGALCILDDSLRKVTAIAREDVSLAVITRQDLDRLIDANPRLGAKLLKEMLLTVSDRLRKSFDRLVTFF